MLLVGIPVNNNYASSVSLPTQVSRGTDPQSYPPDIRRQSSEEESRELFLLRMARDEAIGNDRQGSDRYWQEAIALSETTWGPDHPVTAAFLGKFASALDEQQRYVDAEALYRRALKIHRSRLDPSDASTGVLLEQLATNLELQGRSKEAEDYYRQALAIVDRPRSDQSMLSVTLSNLGRSLNSQGRFGEAEPFLRRALQIAETTNGQDSPDVVLSLNNLTANLEAEGRVEEARSLRARARALPTPPDAGRRRVARRNFTSGRSQNRA